MDIKRIEEIQKETAYPDSVSVQQALLKVWNECEQEKAVKNKSSMELENKIKCVLMDFEINEITLQEATKRILLLLDVVGRSEQENAVKNNAVLPLVNARAFVESCGDMTEYVDGSKIAHRFKKFTIPVIEYNELRKAADKWNSEHVR